MYHMIYQSLTIHFVFVGFVWFFASTGIIFLNIVNKLIFVMVKCGVLFEVRTEFSSTIQKRFCFRGVTMWGVRYEEVNFI
jgi:hypothetical protein